VGWGSQSLDGPGCKDPMTVPPGGPVPLAQPCWSETLNESEDCARWPRRNPPTGKNPDQSSCSHDLRTAVRPEEIRGEFRWSRPWTHPCPRAGSCSGWAAPFERRRLSRRPVQFDVTSTQAPAGWSRGFFFTPRRRPFRPPPGGIGRALIVRATVLVIPAARAEGSALPDIGKEWCVALGVSAARLRSPVPLFHAEPGPVGLILSARPVRLVVFRKSVSPNRSRSVGSPRQSAESARTPPGAAWAQPEPRHPKRAARNPRPESPKRLASSPTSRSAKKVSRGTFYSRMRVWETGGGSPHGMIPFVW